jgi:hypothetical protein
MKKLFVLAIVTTIMLSGCADSKTFKKADGTWFTAQPYGWMDKNDFKIDGVQYEVCVGNVVWSILTSETIVGPIILTGVGLYEPVSYIEPRE